MFQAILFDLDGTLTDSREGITRCVQYALHAMGIEEPDLKKLEAFVGPPLDRSFMENYQMDQETAWKAVEKFRERFATVGIYENRVYPGVPEMLRALKEAGRTVAVASSKPQVFIKEVLRYFALQEYFDVVVGSELDGTRTDKEEVIAEALRQLGIGDKIRRSEGVMVGDRKFDIQGARAHGLTSVGVLYGCAPAGELEAAGADYLAVDVEELTKILLR